MTPDYALSSASKTGFNLDIKLSGGLDSQRERERDTEHVLMWGKREEKRRKTVRERERTGGGGKTET